MKFTLPKAIGNKELEKHRSGKRLTQRKAIHAKCADCMGYYIDGRVDCLCNGCPLYQWMPYRNVEEIYSATTASGSL